MTPINSVPGCDMSSISLMFIKGGWSFQSGAGLAGRQLMKSGVHCIGFLNSMLQENIRFVLLVGQGFKSGVHNIFCAIF